MSNNHKCTINSTMNKAQRGASAFGFSPTSRPREETRGKSFGKVGALKIHKILYNLSLKMRKPMLQLPFESFTSNIESRLKLIRYTGLKPSKAQIARAEQWIKR